MTHRHKSSKLHVFVLSDVLRQGPCGIASGTERGTTGSYGGLRANAERGQGPGWNDASGVGEKMLGVPRGGGGDMTTNQASAVIELCRALGWSDPSVINTGGWPNQWSLDIGGKVFNQERAALAYIQSCNGEPQRRWPSS